MSSTMLSSQSNNLFSMIHCTLLYTLLIPTLFYIVNKYIYLLIESLIVKKFICMLTIYYIF